MKFSLLLVFIAVVGNFGVCFAQDEGTTNEELVPRSYVLPFVASQPESPIKITKFFVTRDSSGKILTRYEVKNISDKPVKSYVLARLYNDNTGIIAPGVQPQGNKLLLPGGRVRNYDVDFSNPRMASLSKERMEKILFILVAKVEFADGSVYEDEKVVGAFEQFSESNW